MKTLGWMLAGLVVLGSEPGGARPEFDWPAWLDAHTTAFSGVVLVGRGAAIEVSRAYGLADRSRALPSTPETRFNLGSINKTFTAIAIAQLIQQGRVTLDDPLAKYLPDYPNAAAAAKITIRDLVTHRSGVATFMRADFGNLTVAEMVKRVGAEPQAFAPGERQEYSNGGYVVLGRVVEVVSGEPYSTYVADHIYRPAGMTQSGFVDAGTAASGAALGYSAAGGRGGPMSARPVEPGNPAGGGYSTASDLFNFARALRSGRLLDQRMTDYVLNGTFAGTSGPRFGFALREQIVGAHRFIGNGGGAPGVNAEFRFEPAGDFTVVVLSNTSPPSATELLSAIMNQIAGTTESRASAAGSAQAPAAPAPTRAAANSGVRAEIEALHAKMTAAFRERPESVAAFYTPDARILGGGQRASGDQIRSYWAQMPAGASWALEILDIGGSDQEPWILGRSTLSRPAGPAMAVDYVAILRRQPDGTLKYHVDIFTASVQPRG